MNSFLLNIFSQSSLFLCLTLVLLSKGTLSAQNDECWEVVRSLDFNQFQNQLQLDAVSGIQHSSGFTLANYGASGLYADKCVGTYLGLDNHWGFSLPLPAGNYRIRADVKGNKSMIFTATLINMASPSVRQSISAPQFTPGLSQTSPGVAFGSNLFSVDQDGVFRVLIESTRFGFQSGSSYARIDNVVLEKQCITSPPAEPPTVFFTTDSLFHQEGSLGEVCVGITTAPNEIIEVVVQPPSNAEEHFPGIGPRLLSFSATNTAPQCFSIESLANGLYDGPASYVFDLAVVDNAVELSQPDSLVLVLQDDTDFSDCNWAGSDQVICLGDSVQLGAVYTDVSLQQLCTTEDFCYAWEPEGAFNPNVRYDLRPYVSPSETTDYIIWVTDGQGNLFSDTVRVEVIDNPGVTISPAQPSLCNEFVTLTATSLQTGMQYQWSTGETGTQIQVATAGTYQVTATTADGCGVISEVTVTESLPDLEIAASSLVLCAASSQVTLTAQSDATAPNYYWRSDLFQGVLSREAELTVSIPGTYYVGVQDMLTSCVNATEVTIYANPSLVIQASDPILCNGQTVNLSGEWLSINTPGIDIPDSTATWQWSTGETTPGITVTEGGIYSVTATFPNGCSYTATHNLPATKLELEITADSLFACAEAPMLLEAQVIDGEGTIKYSWSTGSNESKIVVDTLGIYSVTVSDVHECEYVAEVEVEECPFSCDVQQLAEGYACGSDSTLLIEDHPRLLTQLKPGDSFWAGDFRVEVNSVTGAGAFNGRGIIKVPYFEQAQVNVWLENVRIDRSCKMIGGEVRVEGVGAKLLSDELAEALNDLLETLDDIDNALQVIDQVLGTVGNVVNSSDEVSGLLSEDWNILQGAGPLVDEYPYLPSGLQSDINSAITCYLTNPPDTCIARMNEVINELIQVINAMFKADFTIYFEPYTLQHYGFDSLVYPQMQDDYGHLTVANRDYYVGWKSIEVGTTDSVVAIIPDHINPDSLVFEDNNGNEIPWSDEDGQAILSVPNTGSHEETSQIYPVQLRTDSSGQIEKKYAGKLDVISYERKEIEVVLVPVNGAGAALTPQDITRMEQELEHIYQPAVVGFTVELMGNLDLTWFDNSLDTAGSHFYTAYNSEMNDIKSVVQDQPSYDPAKYYIILVDAADGGLLQGFMPRGRNIGFVVTNGQVNLTRTMAHELGHGAFLLKHTFEEFPTLPLGSTDNLMDYSDGTHLHKYQWDLVHNPPFVSGVLDRDEDAYSLYSGITNLLFDIDQAQGCDQNTRGIKIIGNKDYIDIITGTITMLASFSEAGSHIVRRAIAPIGKELVIFQSQSGIGNAYSAGNSETDYGVVNFNLNQGFETLDAEDGSYGQPISQSLLTSLGHEISHHKTEGPPSGKLIHPETGYQTSVLADEPYAVKIENRIRRDFELQDRTHYSGLLVFQKKAEQSIYTGWYDLVSDPIYNSNYENAIPDNEMDRIRQNWKVCQAIRRTYFTGGTAIRDLYEAPYNDVKHVILYLSTSP